VGRGCLAKTTGGPQSACPRAPMGVWAGGNPGPRLRRFLALRGGQRMGRGIPPGRRCGRPRPRGRPRAAGSRTAGAVVGAVRGWLEAVSAMVGKAKTSAEYGKAGASKKTDVATCFGT